MLLIHCPWCGEREQTEFSYHGEAHIIRPHNPDELSDEQWAAYLFMRKNPKGVHYERWMHAFGCRRFFNMARHTVTGHMYGSYKIGEDKPAAAVQDEQSPPARPAAATKTPAAAPAKAKIAAAAPFPQPASNSGNAQ